MPVVSREAPALAGEPPRCELCEEPVKLQVHQIRKPDQLGKPGPGLPPWAALMARKRRKTLVAKDLLSRHLAAWLTRSVRLRL
jgi:hypothetical protein